MMPAYVVLTLRVSDPDTYRRYTGRTPEVIARHGGRFLTRGAPVETLEGTPFTDRLVILEFPDTDAARAFYDDPQYQELSVWRRNASEDGRMLLQAGAEGPAPAAGV